MVAPTHSLKKYAKQTLISAMGLMFLGCPILYVKCFDYPLSVVVFDEFLILCLVSILSIICVIAARGRKYSSRAIFIKLPISLTMALFVCMLIIFGGAFLTNIVWGDTFTFGLLKTYVSHMHEALDVLPLSVERRATLLNELCFALILFAATTLVFWRALTADFFAMYVKLCTVSRNKPQTLAYASVYLLIIAVTSVTICLTYIVAFPGLLRGEPIIAFLGLNSISNLTWNDNQKLAIALQDHVERLSYSKLTNFGPRNIVLIVADALRADHMGVYGYNRQTTPFLTGLYESNHIHRVDMALSTCSETYCGVASMLASRPLYQLTTKNFKLHSLLHDLGYKVNFFLSGDHRSWNYLFDLYGQDVDDIYDFKTLNAKDVNNDSVIIAALETFSHAQQQPNFFYFHLMSSHVMGTKLPEFNRYKPYFSENMRIISFWNELAGIQRVENKIISNRLTQIDLDAAINRYDNGILQVDFFISEIFRLLDEKEYLKNSTIIIVGDHGDGLGEHGHVGHTRYLYQEDIRIPFLVYDQDLSIYRNREFATQVDVAPTLIDRLGLPVPRGWQGVSLLQPPSDRLTFHQTRRGSKPCIALIDKTASSLLKYLRCRAGDEVEEAVYNLTEDPLEKNNLALESSTEELSFYREETRRHFSKAINFCDALECVD